MYFVEYEIEQYDEEKNAMVPFLCDMKVNAKSAEAAIKTVQALVAVEQHIFPDHVVIVSVKRLNK